MVLDDTVYPHVFDDVCKVGGLQSPIVDGIGYVGGPRTSACLMMSARYG